MQNKVIERYFFFGILLAVIVFSFLIFRPFLAVLVIGACLAVIFHPIYEWFISLVKKKWLASLLTVILFLLILLGPLFLLGSIVLNQTQDLYHSFVVSGNIDPFLSKVGESINRIMPSGFNFNIEEKTAGLVSVVLENTAKIFTATVTTLFSFLLLLLTLFYFLRDGEHFKKILIDLSPLSDTDDMKITAQLSRAVNGIMKGYLLIGLIQGTLAGIGLAIFGVPHPALWAVLAGIASLVPSIGTALVSVPAIIYLLATGETAGAIGYLIWATLIVGTVDNFLNPVIVGSKLNIPPLIILFSVLGGVVLMGPVGLLIGPLAISLLQALVSIYRNGYKPA